MKQICFILFTLLIAACTKQHVAKGIPVCIKYKINSFEKDCCKQNAEVRESVFQNKIVYEFYPGNCGADFASLVLDSDCNILGSLGGFAGNTKINGEDFSHATAIRTVWSN